MIYLISSLRLEGLELIAQRLRAEGYEIFDDWRAAGPRADDEWMKYEKDRGRTYEQALDGYAAKHVFGFDRWHLDRAQAAILVTPAGKSAHLELGYMLGRGKPGYVLFGDEPERWDVMYQFATGVHFNIESLIEGLRRLR